VLLLAVSYGDSTEAATAPKKEAVEFDLSPRAIDGSGFEEAEYTRRPYFRRPSLISPYFRRPSLSSENLGQAKQLDKTTLLSNNDPCTFSFLLDPQKRQSPQRTDSEKSKP
jgi:hypothetical protein